ncbi:MAG: glutamyl-tRNA reductase [Marivibrio sp.]|uniref:glutamyl-tRNA reductase n=1 Tax=Marivibrio sp. TaxID=2039719 RepID=UPI0032EEBB7F
MAEPQSVVRPALARPYSVGATHRTADARLREALFVEDAVLDETYQALIAAGLAPAAMISTCDRVELHGVSPEPEAAALKAEAFLAERAGVSPARMEGAVYRLYDADAVHHLYRVAAALESQMVGEAQVLGQLKASVARAQAAGAIDSDADRLFQNAFQVAKRVRSQTRIGEGAVSVAAAAVRVAGDLFGDLSRRRGLLIGLGEAAEVMLEQFERAGLTHFDQTGPARRTERQAVRAGRNFAPFDRLEEALAGADVVVTAGGLGRYLIDRAALEAALKRRKRRPMLILDCGVPSDVDPAVDALDEAFRYTLADVEKLAERGQLDRRAEAEEAARMVEAAVVEWRRAQAEREGIPVLIALRDHFEETRAQVLQAHPRADAEEATRLLVNRLLHRPSEALRAIAGDGEAADLRDTVTVNRVLARLFGVGPAAEAAQDNENEDR